MNEKVFWVNIELKSIAFYEYEGELDIEQARKDTEERIKKDLNTLGYLDSYSIKVEVK